jgi:hypothetical protein
MAFRMSSPFRNSDRRAGIDFNAPASLRKWPSHNGKRLTDARYPDPYLLIDSTLGECIKMFITKPTSQQHLYEIHTAPQPPRVSAVIGAEHIEELAKVRELFLALE